MDGFSNDGFQDSFQSGDFPPVTDSGTDPGGPVTLSEESIAAIVAALLLQMGPVIVTLEISDPDGAPVVGARITVQNTGIGYSDSLGNVVVSLNPGTYTVLVSPTAGVLFAPVVITVPVASTYMASIVGTVPVPIPPPADAAKCALSLTLFDWLPAYDATVKIVKLPEEVNGRAFTEMEQTQLVNDSTGVITFNAVPKGATISVKCSEAGYNNTRFFIPLDADTFEISTAIPV